LKESQESHQVDGETEVCTSPRFTKLMKHKKSELKPFSLTLLNLQTGISYRKEIILERLQTCSSAAAWHRVGLK
jgi:hypothetical protein